MYHNPYKHIYVKSDQILSVGPTMHFCKSMTLGTHVF